MEWHKPENKPKEEKHLYLAVTERDLYGRTQKRIKDAFVRNGKFRGNPNGIGHSEIPKKKIDYWAYKEIPEHPHNADKMSDSEIKELLGASGDTVRFDLTYKGMFGDKNKRLDSEQVCNNPHFINGNRGVVIADAD